MDKPLDGIKCRLLLSNYIHFDIFFFILYSFLCETYSNISYNSSTLHEVEFISCLILILPSSYNLVDIFLSFSMTIV